MTNFQAARKWLTVEAMDFARWPVCLLLAASAVGAPAASVPVHVWEKQEIALTASRDPA